ncbi:hypothetical protein SAMN04488000_1403 [Lentzea albida]|uniref:Replication-associated protein ORF2/G2P domain-containing protein n=2 Tax=Lentzea albida TaxID=65499 RepID=A0A1H9XID5_9PSEU|nr:hypothetical protein SAMN04488000_1403 [Lentzea albida]
MEGLEEAEQVDDLDLSEEEKERKRLEILNSLPENIRHLFERRQKEYRKSAVYRARQTLRRVILQNFTSRDKFVTLTFRDGEVEDLSDVSQTNPCFKRFIQRLNRWIQKKVPDFSFKYATVVEFQDKNGRGAVHYHLICNVPWIPHEELERLWSHGFVGINAIRGKGRKDKKDVDNIGAYMIKYMLKDFNDPRLKGKKSYFCSKGLDRPKELRGQEASAWLWKYKFDQKEEVFTSQYESEYHGLVTYREYNLKRSNDVLCCTANTALHNRNLQLQYILLTYLCKLMDAETHDLQKTV